LQSYPTTALNESDILLAGSKHTLTSPTYFRGVEIPSTPSTPRIYAPEFMHSAILLLLVTKTYFNFTISRPSTFSVNRIYLVPYRPQNAIFREIRDSVNFNQFSSLERPLTS